MRVIRELWKNFLFREAWSRTLLTTLVSLICRTYPDVTAWQQSLIDLLTTGILDLIFRVNLILLQM